MTDPSDFPPSQASQSSSSIPQSKIFLDGHGVPLRFFVASFGILNRPKLVKNLIRRGGVLCTKQEDAKIVLLNPNTQDGQELVANWGDSPGTIFLDASWVDRCREADRALLADDGWGGCLLNTQDIAARHGADGMDDGLDEDDNDVRIGRSQARVSSSNTTAAAAVQPSASMSTQREDIVMTSGMPHGPADTTSQQMQAQPVSQTTAAQLMAMQQQLQQQPMVNADNGQVVALSQLTNLDPQAMFMLFATAQQMFSQQHQHQNQQQLMTLGPMSQPFVMPNMMVGPGMMNMPSMNAGQFPPFASFAPEIQQQLQFQQQFHQLQQQQLQQFQQRQNSPPIHSFTQLPHHSSVSTLAEDTATPSPPQSHRSSEILRPSGSLGQKRSFGLADAIAIASTTPSSRSVSPQRQQQQQTKRRRKSRASDETLVDGQSQSHLPPSSSTALLSFSTAQQPPTPTLTPTPPPSSQPKNKARPSRTSSASASAAAGSGPIFVNKDGKPLRFLVQVNMSIRQKRKVLTNEITAGGGQIVKSLTDADYYISEDPMAMGSNLKKERREVIAHRDEAISTGVKPLWYMFITDCIRHGKLLAMEDYELKKRGKVALIDKQNKDNGLESEEEVKKPAKKLLSASASVPSMPTVRAKKATGTSSSFPLPTLGRKPVSVAGESLSAPVGTNTSANGARPVARKSTGKRRASEQHANEMTVSTTSALYMRTPSPPPANGQVSTNGRMRYTDEEKAFILSYVRYLLLRRRDPQMPKYTMAKDIYEKLPHHSVTSIATYLGGYYMEEVEALRQEVTQLLERENKEGYAKSPLAPPQPAVATTVAAVPRPLQLPLQEQRQQGEATMLLSSANSLSTHDPHPSLEAFRISTSSTNGTSLSSVPNTNGGDGFRAGNHNGQAEEHAPPTSVAAVATPVPSETNSTVIAATATPGEAPAPAAKAKSGSDPTAAGKPDQKVEKKDAEKTQKEKEGTDMEVIARYFATLDPPNENESDEMIWQRLAEKHVCLSDVSWPDFYERHMEEVQVRIEEYDLANEA